MYFLLNFIWVHDTQRAFMAHKEVKKLTLGIFFFYHIFRPPFLCVFNVAILVKSKKNGLHRKLWLLFKSMLFWNKIIISKQRKTYTVQWSLLPSSTTKLRTNCKVENIASCLQPGYFYTDVLFPFPYQAACHCQHRHPPRIQRKWSPCIFNKMLPQAPMSSQSLSSNLISEKNKLK